MVLRYTPGDTRAWTFGAHDESYEQVYGNLGELTDPRCNRPSGTPASTFFPGTRADAIAGIAISPDGSLYVAESCHTFTGPGHDNSFVDVGHLRARRLDPAAERYIASPDGARYFVFDSHGRHLETRNASTHGLLYSFQYDSAGRLSQVVDSDGDTTSITRDGAGTPSAVVAPFGQQTALHVNPSGYLDGIRPDPSNPAYAMQYVDARGLLQSFVTPRGTTTQYGYDALGVLISTTDPANTTYELVQQTGASTRTSTETGPSGTTTITQQRSDDGRETHIVTNPDGTATTLSARGQQQQRFVSSDGTMVDRTLGEDARWGTSEPVTSSSVSLPSGLRRCCLSRYSTGCAPRSIVTPPRWSL